MGAICNMRHYHRTLMSNFKKACLITLMYFIKKACNSVFPFCAPLTIFSCLKYIVTYSAYQTNVDPCSFQLILLQLVISFDDGFCTFYFCLFIFVDNYVVRISNSSINQLKKIFCYKTQKI